MLISHIRNGLRLGHQWSVGVAFFLLEKVSVGSSSSQIGLQWGQKRKAVLSVSFDLGEWIIMTHQCFPFSGLRHHHSGRAEAVESVATEGTGTYAVNSFLEDVAVSGGRGRKRREKGEGEGRGLGTDWAINLQISHQGGEPKTEGADSGDMCRTM